MGDCRRQRAPNGTLGSIYLRYNIPRALALFSIYFDVELTSSIFTASKKH